MKYGTPKCPECGETVSGECDTAPSEVEVNELPDGHFEHEGGSEMFWDGSTNVNDVEAATLRPYVEESAKIAERVAYLDKHMRVQCSNGHEWDTTFEHDDYL